MLAAAGYDVRVFNVISFQKSMHATTTRLRISEAEKNV